MAYMVFREDSDTVPAALPGERRDAARSASEHLSPLEWSVVALARRDRLSTLREPGRVAIAMGGLFGTRHSPRLACARLEALRRLAVLVWRRGSAVDAQELAAFTEAGFTSGQYRLVIESVATARAVPARKWQS
jgi:hypothetical protein